MVFRRKKSKEVPSQATSTMRGRQATGSGQSTSQNPLARRFLDDDEPDTIDLDQPARFQSEPDGEPAESTTRLLSGGASKPGSSEQGPLEDPVSGFLVIISGPGRGKVLTLGHGMNPVGRDPSQRVSLDFGDQRISRSSHCLMTFDALSGKFYIQPGEGRNLAYLDDQPVLVPTELLTGQHIRLGDTILRFVPFCGKDFSWEG
jgi:hypothetical protein